MDPLVVLAIPGMAVLFFGYSALLDRFAPKDWRPDWGGRIKRWYKRRRAG